MYDVLVVCEGTLRIIEDHGFDDDELLSMYGLNGGIILDTFDIGSGEAEDVRRILDGEI